MTPTVYLLLSLCLFFLITTCVYAVYCNQQKVKLVDEDFLDKDHTEYSSSLESENEHQDESLTETMPKPEEYLDVESELKKCNQRLNRNLKTLSYISFMKANSSLDGQRLSDLDNLKESVQYEVVRITKQINYYKSQIKEEVAA